MIEMELKAILKNKLKVREEIEAYGCDWSPIYLQIDTIYEGNDMQEIVHTPIFRIRKCNNRNILTLKVLMNDVNTAEELELDISDDRIMDLMLQIIGFFPKIQVIKRRQDTEYRGFNICIDEVEGLGDFIEVEKISKVSDDGDKIYREMKSVLLDLGIEEHDLKKEKYYEMLLNSKEERK